MKNSFGAITLIVVGALALARNLGYLEVSITDLIMTWWPLILIGLGISFFFNCNSGVFFCPQLSLDSFFRNL